MQSTKNDPKGIRSKYNMFICLLNIKYIITFQFEMLHKSVSLALIPQIFKEDPLSIYSNII